MICFLFEAATCKRPIILIPGLMGSILDGDVTKKKYWFCSKQSNANVWFNDKYAVPPLYKCLFDDIKLVWDSKKQEPAQPDYINLSTVDFGGIKGINHVDTLLFDVHIVPYYSIMISKLEKAGFVVGKDIFGAPFDWRFGVYQKEEFWNKFRKLVEDVYSKSNSKVVIAGHSMGGFLLNVFLTQKTTAEWRAKYIDSGIYIAPSFGGSGLVFNALWSKRFPIIDFLGEFEETVSSLGGIHIHMLNHEVFGDKVVAKGVHGEDLTAKDLTKYLVNNGKLYGDYYEIFKKSEPFFQHAPAQPDVPSLIIYNSVIPTIEGIDLTGNKVLFGTGDGMVNTEGPKYACDHWAQTKCYDLKSANPIDNHLSMLYRDSLNQYIIDFLNRK
jgi:hypothetical protein